jgi:hypothetical protein
MESPDSIEKATLLAKASTADVYVWGVGHVLKLFHERTPWHANEVTATRIAHEARLPVPEVIDGLIEVGGREGIVFERIVAATASLGWDRTVASIDQRVSFVKAALGGAEHPWLSG